MAMDPRLRFFVVRESADKACRKLVPLVPADLLPDWIEFAGTPRGITLEQAKGMACVGVCSTDVGAELELESAAAAERQNAALRSLPLRLLQATEGTMGQAATPSEGTSTPSMTVEDDDNDVNGPATMAPSQALTSSTPTAATPAASPAVVADGMTAAVEMRQRQQAHVPPQQKQRKTSTASAHPKTDALPKASLAAPVRAVTDQRPRFVPSPDVDDGTASALDDPERRESGVAYFCRHWCWHGTCKWGRQCRFRHSMPSTPQGLDQVGLRDFPAWWRSCVGAALAEATGFALSPPPPVPLAPANTPRLATATAPTSLAHAHHQQNHPRRAAAAQAPSAMQTPAAPGSHRHSRNHDAGFVASTGVRSMLRDRQLRERRLGARKGAPLAPAAHPTFSGAGLPPAQVGGSGGGERSGGEEMVQHLLDV